jgi:hypothetical protein
MAKFNTAIADAMDALDDEIAELEGELEKLRETRENLESLLDEEDGDTPTRERKVRKSTVTATDKPVKRGRPAGGESTKRARIVRMLKDKVKVSDIADELGVTPGYVYTIRKEEDLDSGERGKPVTRSQRSQRAQRDNGDGQSRKTRIKRMLNAGDMSVKEIADELGIGTGYVYNVKREMSNA